MLSAFVGWLCMGCINSSSNEATPQSDCRIQRCNAVTKAKFYDHVSQTTYDYDAQGNLSAVTTTMEKRPLNGAIGNQTGNKTVNHSYDADGFLTASTSQELYIRITDKTAREQITTTTSYSYVSGRLSGYTIKRIGAHGITTTTTGSLAYDASGDLVSKTETNAHVVHDPAIAKELPASPTGIIRIWTYQKNKLIDYVERFGASEFRPFTIKDSVITKITGTNYEVRFAYDSQQRVTKQENFVDGQLTEYFVQTWTDAKPMAASLPSFKGFPAIVSVLEYGPKGVLASHEYFYWNSVSKTMQQYNASTYTVQTNAQGFVTNAVNTTKHPYPATADQDFVTTETYTYTGCQ